jgi:hypothetical protein
MRRRTAFIVLTVFMMAGVGLSVGAALAGPALSATAPEVAARGPAAPGRARRRGADTSASHVPTGLRAMVSCTLVVTLTVDRVDRRRRGDGV